MNYKEKYLKYKLKYLNLRNKFSGGSDTEPFERIDTEPFERIDSFGSIASFVTAPSFSDLEPSKKEEGPSEDNGLLEIAQHIPLPWENMNYEQARNLCQTNQGFDITCKELNLFRDITLEVADEKKDISIYIYENVWEIIHKNIQYTIKNVTLKSSALSVNSGNIFAEVLPSSQVPDEIILIVDTYSVALTDDNIKDAVIEGWHGFKKYGPIEDWNTSAITDMSSLLTFRGFNIDISRWDTSAVTTMSNMFRGAKSFNKDISMWNTSKVTNMEWMFTAAWAFNQDISKWNTSKVTNMERMFSGTKDFNKDISMWNTSAVTNMKFMFEGAKAFNQDINKWDTSAVEDMKGMFEGAKAFNNGSEPLLWEAQSLTDASKMFKDATSLNNTVHLKFGQKKKTNLEQIVDGAEKMCNNTTRFGESIILESNCGESDSIDI